MNKILVKLYVPMIGEEYELWLPVNKKINAIIKLLVKAVNEFTKGYYNPIEMPYLYDKITAEVYDINLKIIETQIRNGSELILI